MAGGAVAALLVVGGVMGVAKASEPTGAATAVGAAAGQFATDQENRL